jgi:hypothetical protein
MKRWKPYVDILAYCGLFLFFMVSDLVLYYGPGRHHSKVPFYLCLIPTILVFILGAMAVYQTHKHRNDPDPW